MNFADVKARKFGSNTYGYLEEDGKWKVIMDMVEGISFDGINFEEKKLEVMSIDKDFVNAYDVCERSLALKYQQEVGKAGTLFKELLNDNAKTDLSPALEANSN